MHERYISGAVEFHSAGQPLSPVGICCQNRPQSGAEKLEQLQRKKRNAEVTLSFEELGGCIPATRGPEELLEEKELRRAIVAFLQTRRSISRILFLRRYFFFDSVKEIAQAYDLSDSKVKSSLMRTRNQLKLYLIKEGYDL